MARARLAELKKNQVAVAPPIAPAPNSAPASTNINLSGRWRLQVDCGVPKWPNLFLQFSQSGNSFSGSLTGVEGSGPFRIYNGKIDSNSVSFIRESDEGKQQWTGKISNNLISGTLRTGYGNQCTWVASR